MFEPFKSPRLLVERARKHLDEFDARQSSFIAKHKHAKFSETEPETGDQLFKIRVRQDLLEQLSPVVFDIVNGLRSSLDHAVFDAARAIGRKPNPKGTKFPFGKTIEDARRDFQRYKDGEIPQELLPCLLSFEPYQGGKESLWEFNELRGSKIHRVLKPSLANVGTTAILSKPGDFITFGKRGFETMNEWDADKAELTFMRVGADTQFNTDPHPVIRVVLGEAEFLGDKPAVQVFRNFAEVMHRIINGIEAEAVRLASASV